MQLALIEDVDDMIYKKSNTKKLANMNRFAKDGFEAYHSVNSTTMKADKLPARKSTDCRWSECLYCIDAHAKAAQKSGATEE